MKNTSVLEKLCGDSNKLQSTIQIDDILFEDSKIIYRDGVKIDGLTGIGIAGGIRLGALTSKEFVLTKVDELNAEFYDFKKGRTLSRVSPIKLRRKKFII